MSSRRGARILSAVLALGAFVPQIASASDPPVVPPAAEFHRLIASSADAEVVAVALGTDESAAWVEATPAHLRRRFFILDQPTRIAVKAVRFNGRAAKEETAWERTAKLLQLVPQKTAVGKGEVSFAYLDYDSPIAPVPVTVASGANGWKVARPTASSSPKVEIKKQAVGFLLAQAATGNIRRTYHVVCARGGVTRVKQLSAVADVELRLGDTKFSASVKVPITSDAKTVAAFEKSLEEETPKLELLRTESACALVWTGADSKALVVGIPRLERAVLSALLTDIQDRVRALGAPSPKHKLRDLEPLLQRAEIANALAQVPSVKGAFSGQDAPAPGKVRDSLAKLADGYGGIVLRNTVVVGGADWVVYYDVVHRTARVLPASITWTVSAGDPALEVARPDKLSVFYLEARGTTAPPPGHDSDRQFQKALAEAVGVANLPPVNFAYGPVGLPRATLERADDNVSSLKIDWADTRVGERLALRLTVERQERDYLRTVLLEKVGLPLQLSWEGRAFALDRLKDRAALLGRVVLGPKKKVNVITPEANKLEVVVVAGPGVWAGRDGDKAQVTVRYQGQNKTLTFRRGSREPAQATFDLVLDDDGKKPVLRLQYRTTPDGPWVDAEAPVVVIP